MKRFLRCTGLLLATVWLVSCFVAGGSLALAMGATDGWPIVCGFVAMIPALLVSAELIA